MPIVDFGRNEHEMKTRALKDAVSIYWNAFGWMHIAFTKVNEFDGLAYSMCDTV